jgi:type II secretory pathway component PulJ
MPSWLLDGGKGRKVMHSPHVKKGLKQLREERKRSVERARNMIKKRNRQIIAIKSRLTEEARTIPEIAAELKMETADVLAMVMALRKYGEVVEAAKADDYFKYRLVVKADSH